MSEMRLRTGMRVCFVSDTEYALGNVIEHDYAMARVRWDDGVTSLHLQNDAWVEPAGEEN